MVFVGFMATWLFAASLGIKNGVCWVHGHLVVCSISWHQKWCLLGSWPPGCLQHLLASKMVFVGFMATWFFAASLGIKNGVCWVHGHLVLCSISWHQKWCLLGSWPPGSLQHL